MTETSDSQRTDKQEAGKASSWETSGDGDVYVFELWRVIWANKWIIAGTTFVIGVCAAITVLLMPSWYRADVLLVPAEERSSIDLGGSFVGLASLAGISVGGGDVAEAIAVLESRDLTRDFISDLNLLPVLFADSWDAEKGSWLQADPEDQPDIRDGIKYFDETVRSVSRERSTDLVRLSIEWRDPELAAEWANLLVERVNDRMRQRALAEAEENVAYLQSELQDTAEVVLQQSIARLLESELQKLMLARGNRDFAFRIIDRAQVPRRRSRPQRTLFVLVAMFIGGAATTLLVLVRRAS